MAFDKPRPKYKGPEGHENDPRLPDGSVTWDYVGSEGMTLKEWYDFAMGEYLGRVGDTPQTRNHAENQFSAVIEMGLIT
jgi:hypothetical protein